jgi:hypothetical protein
MFNEYVIVRVVILGAFTKVHGRLVGTRTPDLHRVKVAL